MRATMKSTTTVTVIGSTSFDVKLELPSTMTVTPTAMMTSSFSGERPFTTIR